VLTLETAMDPKGVWVTVDSFPSLTLANTGEKKTFTGLLRYVRWQRPDGWLRWWGRRAA